MRSDREFCYDLVISENGGTLLARDRSNRLREDAQGALDCTPGGPRQRLDGRWGTAISTIQRPNALLTFEEPRWLVRRSAMGMNTSRATARRDWDLTENTMDINCAGPFTVTLQP